MSLQPMGLGELTHYVRSLKEGGHVCLIFENEDQKWDLEAEYVKRGLEQGYRAHVSAMKNDLPNLHKALERRGIDVHGLVAEGSLVTDLVTPEVAKDPKPLETWFAAGKAYAEELRGKGKKGLYYASNTSTFFLRHGLLDQLFMLEALVHRKLTEEKLPFGFLCCYDVSDLTPSQRPLALKELLEHYRRIAEENPRLMHSHNVAIYVSREGGVLAQLPK